MPGVYKEKKCPYCGVTHRKRGVYCSKSHANLDRPKEVYEKVSEWMRGTDKGQELQFNLKSMIEDDLPMVGGVSKARDSFVSGGDLWTTDDSW